MKKFIPYYRVSTAKQGRSGLGLEAQKAAVEQYAKLSGGTIIPHPPYIEIESGKRDDRPKLAQAIAHAQAMKATLLIAKLDRLARDVHFLSGLMKRGVDFVCADNPNATPLTIHILAAVAQDEAQRISDRTKAALKARKARGLPLGGQIVKCRNLTSASRIRGSRNAAKARRSQAAEAYDYVRPLCHELRHQGQSLAGIAERLNADGLTTRTGKPWNPTQVMRVLSLTEGN